VALHYGYYEAQIESLIRADEGEEVHSVDWRLLEVEWAFRTLKTGLLEICSLYQ